MVYALPDSTWSRQPGARHPANGRTGTSRDGDDLARVLDEGDPQHDGEEFAELLETEGAGFRGRAVHGGAPGGARRTDVAPGAGTAAVRRGGARAPAGCAGRQPARPAAAGRDRAGPGELRADREHRLPGRDLRRGESGVSDERRRARDGRSDRPGVGRAFQAAHFGPAGRPWSGTRLPADPCRWSSGASAAGRTPASRP